MQHIHYHKGDLRPIVLSKRSLLVGTCQALSGASKPCRCYAMKGQVFCRVHMVQGYGLFTLAVLARLKCSARSGE